MDVTEMVSEFVSLKRRAEAEAGLASPELVRWEVLRQGLLLAQTVPEQSHTEPDRPWVRLETGAGVWDFPVAALTGDGLDVDGPVSLAAGERPVVLLVPTGEEVPIATRAVVAGPAFGVGRRTHLALPYLTGEERDRLAATPSTSREEIAR